MRPKLSISLFFIFIACITMAQHGLVNGDMEGWRRGQFRCCGRNVDLPIEWGIPEQSCGVNFNKFVFLEENPFNVHSGRCSALLSSDTSFFNDVGLQPGMLVYGGYQNSLDSVIRIGQPVPQYGLPIDSNPVELRFWLMMNHDISDTFSYMYLFTRWDSTLHREDTLAFATVDVPDTHVLADDWFEIRDSIDYRRPGNADTVRIIFYGGRSGNLALLGNATWIDDISLVYAGEDTGTSAATGLASQTSFAQALGPTPANDRITIRSDEPSAKYFTLVNLLGVNEMQRTIESATQEMDVSVVSPGAYIAYITDIHGTVIHQQKIVIVR